MLQCHKLFAALWAAKSLAASRWPVRNAAPMVPVSCLCVASPAKHTTGRPDTCTAAISICGCYHCRLLVHQICSAPPNTHRTEPASRTFSNRSSVRNVPAHLNKCKAKLFTPDPLPPFWLIFPEAQLESHRVACKHTTENFPGPRSGSLTVNGSASVSMLPGEPPALT